MSDRVEHRVEHRGMLILFGCLTVVVVGLLVFGIARHTEPTWQHACAMEPTGIADYAGDCFEVRWERLPITVSSNGDDDQRELLRDAIDSLNDDLGIEALVMAVPAEEAQAFVEFGVAPFPAMRDSGGTTTHYFRDRKAVRAEVRIVNVVLIDQLFAVLRHELGHVVGFADDDYSGVLMSDPTYPGNSLSDYDVRAFRSVYGAAK